MENHLKIKKNELKLTTLGFNIIEETDTRYYMKYKRSTYERIY